MALDRVIGVCFGEPDLEFCWVGDDAVDPLEQAQTISILVGAGVKTVAEARAELGLGQASGVVKYNHYHDERGRFTTGDSAAGPGGYEVSAPAPRASGRSAPNPSASGVRVAENDPRLSNPGAMGDVTSPPPGLETLIQTLEQPPSLQAPPAPESGSAPNANPTEESSDSGSTQALSFAREALLTALEALGADVTAPFVAALGAALAATTRPTGGVQGGSVPGRPDMTYRWAQDERSATFSVQADGQTQTLQATQNANGDFVDARGNVLATVQNGPDGQRTLVVDSSAVDAAIATQSSSENGAATGSGTSDGLQTQY